MDIGKKVKLACTYIGISEAELARRLEISPQSLNKRLKTGKFSAEELEKIAAALGGSLTLEFTLSDGTKF